MVSVNSAKLFLPFFLSSILTGIVHAVKPYDSLNAISDSRTLYVRGIKLRFSEVPRSDKMFEVVSGTIELSANDWHYSSDLFYPSEVIIYIMFLFVINLFHF